jgi:hypothetical protein
METFGLDQGLTDQAKTTLSAMLRGMLLCGLLCAGRDGEDEEFAVSKDSVDVEE